VRFHNASPGLKQLCVSAAHGHKRDRRRNDNHGPLDMLASGPEESQNFFEIDRDFLRLTSVRMQLAEIACNDFHFKHTLRSTLLP
jgi:hypothetical protein